MKILRRVTLRPAAPWRGGLLIGLLGATTALAASAAELKTPQPSPPYASPKVKPEGLKAQASLPDWNGWWQPAQGLMFDPDNNYTPPPSPNDIGADFGPKPGSRDTSIPYKAEYQQAYQVAIDRALKGENTDNVGNCMRPHGMPRQMGAAPGPIEIFMLPGQVRMTWGWMNATRRIHTDGRPHLGEDELVMSYMGDSMAHWEGDTLVVDTIGMHGGFYDQSAPPYSNQVHLKERIRLIAKDQLEDIMIIEDPVMLTRPWTVRRVLRRIPEDKGVVLGNYCPPDGNSVDVSSGFEQAILPSEREAAAKAAASDKK